MIKFGTSGWRGIIAEDFTFRNVKIAVQAIAEYLKEIGGNSIVIGYDTRFLSEDFAKLACEILISNNIKVFLSSSDVPTPTVAFYTVKYKASGAINFTASHNDYIYNGLKFSSSSGGPALPEETDRIEKLIKNIDFDRIKIKKTNNSDDIEYYSGAEYLASLENIIDFGVIKRAKKRVVYEAFYGTGRNYVPKLLEERTEFSMINGFRDPLFGKKHPEPIRENLKELSEKVFSSNADIGIATDGDADRFGFIDKDGSYFAPNIILPIVYYYLITIRGMKGNVSRTISTTSMLDRIAKKYGYKAIETPVGFKYIGDTIVKGECIFGGEESGGASISGWLAEKDGILMNALIVEIISVTNKSLKELYAELVHEFGEVFSKRIDFDFSGNKEPIQIRLKEAANSLVNERKILKASFFDGIKIFFDEDNWILYRFSGTEPKVRIYIESTTLDRLSNLESFSKTLFFSAKGVEDEVWF